MASRKHNVEFLRSQRARHLPLLIYECMPYALGLNFVHVEIEVSLDSSGLGVAAKIKQKIIVFVIGCVSKEERLKIISLTT